MEITPGPHNGFWIKEGDKVVMWCSDRGIAEIRLKELGG